MEIKLRIDISEKDTRIFFSPFFVEGNRNRSLAGRTPVELGPDIMDVSQHLLKCVENGNNLDKIKKYGLDLYKVLFPENIKKVLSGSKGGELLLWISPSLAFIPFEAAFDGNNFLSTKFSTGIIIDTWEELDGKAIPARENRKKDMLLISDPCDNLPAAYEEGKQLEKMLEFSDGDEVPRLRIRQKADRSFFKDNFSNYDIIHFCGHAQYSEDESESGLMLHDGILSAHDLKPFRGIAKAPNLVFVNGCSSAKGIDAAKVGGLAGEFLKAGVESFIGAIARIPDEKARSISLAFYRRFKRNVSPSGALFWARKDALKENNVAGLLYRFYGDPFKKEVEKKPPAITAIRPKKRPVARKIVLSIVALIFLLYMIGYLLERKDDQSVIYIPKEKVETGQ